MPRNPHAWRGKGKHYVKKQSNWDWDGSVNRTPHYIAHAKVVDDFGNLTTYRRCKLCRCWKEQSPENFNVRARYETGYVKSWDPRCRDCRSPIRRERYYAQDPEARHAKAAEKWKRTKAAEDYEERKRKQTEAAADWRRRNRDRVNATARRYRERLKQDPERWAQRMADARMRYRLRQEQDGAVLVPKPPETNGATGPEVPVKPLLAAVERYLERVKWVEGEEDSEGKILAQLDLDSRTLYDWRRDRRQSVRRSIVERILVRTQWNWWDIYPEPVNGHAEDPEAWRVYKIAHLAFEGEPVE